MGALELEAVLWFETFVLEDFDGISALFSLEMVALWSQIDFQSRKIYCH